MAIFGKGEGCRSLCPFLVLSQIFMGLVPFCPWSNVSPSIQAGWRGTLTPDLDSAWQGRWGRDVFLDHAKPLVSFAFLGEGQDRLTFTSSPFSLQLYTIRPSLVMGEEEGMRSSALHPLFLPSCAYDSSSSSSSRLSTPLFYTTQTEE